MAENYSDTIIIGAGPAGLSLSYFLQENNLSFLVLEKSRPFAAWYNRFDHFRMNTANWMNQLPGSGDLLGSKNHLQGFPNQLATGGEFLSYLQLYAKAVNPPLKNRYEVTKLRFLGRNAWELNTSRGIFNCHNVVICTGSLAKPGWPRLAYTLRETTPSLHASSYRNPEQLNTRRVLVVGSGSSGIQICQDLARSSKFSEIILAESNNRHFPWKILGIPVHLVVKSLGLFDCDVDSVLGRLIVSASGTGGDPATEPSPDKLARNYGVRIVKKLVASSAAGIVTADNQLLSTRDLTIIWCTGYQPVFPILPEPVRAAIARIPGWPVASRGKIPGFPGLYFLGLRFQSTLSSHILYGIVRDARQLAAWIKSEMSQV